jgi:hypothetical protein
MKTKYVLLMPEKINLQKDVVEWNYIRLLG